MDHLLKEERQQLILNALQENNKVTVPELSQQFHISEVTIRRDLAELASSGKLIRAHRGALRIAAAPPEPPVVQRISLDRELKESIARAALPLVEDGDSIFLGSGSTMALFARLLTCKKRLTVFTNALNIAEDLVTNTEDVTVVVTGGVVRAAELSLLGHIAELTLPEMRVNKIIMGVQALSLENGWTSDQMSEVSTTRRILEMSTELIILADHTKLARSAAAFIAPLSRVKTLVTDEQADPKLLAMFEAQGVRVIVAGE
ncbi:MAG: DeoR/GlpR transcriptional regulator [Anaerolineae bacterium]|nr:DeoR/GlpR transcriptional regulator [Anaerolineae bacterium]